MARGAKSQGFGVFAPYTIGNHACLGAGAAEV